MCVNTQSISLASIGIHSSDPFRRGTLMHEWSNSLVSVSAFKTATPLICTHKHWRMHARILILVCRLVPWVRARGEQVYECGAASHLHLHDCLDLHNEGLGAGHLLIHHLKRNALMVQQAHIVHCIYRVLEPVPLALQALRWE